MLFSDLRPAVEHMLRNMHIPGQTHFARFIKDELAAVESPVLQQSQLQARQLHTLYDLRARYLDWELGTGYLGFFARNLGTRYTFVRRVEVVLQMLPEWLHDDAKPIKSRRILEIGCGAGLLCLELAQRTKFVIGLDISHFTLDFANKLKEYVQYTNVAFQQGDAEYLAFQDNTFDLVICSEVLEHLLVPQQTLKEIRRVLKPDGTLILTTPCAVSLSDITMKVFRWFNPHLETEKDVQFDKKTYLAVQRKTQEADKNETKGSTTEERASFLRVHERFRYTTLVKMFQGAGFIVENARGTIIAFPPHYQVFYRVCPGWLLSAIQMLEQGLNKLRIFQRFGSVTTCFRLVSYGITREQ